MTQLLDIISNSGKTEKEILNEFTQSQIQDWPLAAANFKGLEKVRERTYQFDGFVIRTQFNPERMRSSVAEVDKISIAARKCFLCNENRPKEQGAIEFGDDFLILVNPFPIFRNHFTISCNRHIDQRFIGNAKTLLELAKAMQGFTVFYNGPECGASAPDHLHFQAGESSFMPITVDYNKLKTSGRQLFSGKDSQVWAFDNYLRKMISVETCTMDEALEIIGIYYQHFQAMQPEKVEPMMNALCSLTDGKWTIHLFPRKAHRPSYFYEEGEKQILISPGSVDFGGVFILPRREDFDKITKEDIVDILQQVCLDANNFQDLTNQIQNDLSNFA
jgi:ATP adenylyltransferase (5'',5''''''-P-1,P-4-tetraphosphate phosphorylase II)